MIRKWLLLPMLAGLAGLMSSEAGADGKAAISACQRSADAQEDPRTIEVCGKVIDDPDVVAADKVAALVIRCIAYYYLDNNDRAIEDCGAALAIAPTELQALKHRGLAYIGESEYDEAFLDLDRAIALDTTDSYLYVSRGVARYGRGELDAAIEDYERAFKFGDIDGRAFYRRGVALLAKGETQRAMDDLARSVPLNAKGITGPLFSALASFYLGKYADAATYYGRYEERDSYDTFFLFISRKRVGLHDAAESLDGATPPAGSWYGHLKSYLQGKISKTDLLKAAEDPDASVEIGQHCEAAFFIGQMELIAGNSDEARQRFNSVLQSCPRDYVELTAARAELTRM